tara:strand:- start:773 stop:955 length:183 start_codon:yes stop_codon:yes gene_type:complete
MKFILILVSLQTIELPMINNDCEQTYLNYVQFIKNTNHKPMEPRILILYKDQPVAGYICK